MDTNYNLSEEDRQKELTILKNSYDMYEKSKVDMKTRRTEMTDGDGNRIYSDKSIGETMQLMETMQQDIVDKYVQLGGTVDELKAYTSKKGRKKTVDRKALEEIMIREKMKEDMQRYIAKMNSQHVAEEEPQPTIVETPKVEEPVFEPETIEMPKFEPVKETVIEDSPVIKEEYAFKIDHNAGNNRVSYDTVKLPSGGECYKKKIREVPIAYLTGYDENLIVSPNLYNNGKLLDTLLKTKIMDENIKSEDLLKGDRDALILWLRATSYGPDFKVTAVDKATGIPYETVVDLSKLKYKPFTLKGDENGYFDFVLPFSGDKVKFKFLSYKEDEKLNKMNEDEDREIKKGMIEGLSSQLALYVDEEENVDRNLKLRLNEAIKTIKAFSESINVTDSAEYSHAATNRLSACIVSVNGITDRKYINEYVMFMNVRDSSALRKYIVSNEPGVDFNVEVERPESLGGGSESYFLEYDEFIFLNNA